MDLGSDAESTGKCPNCGAGEIGPWCTGCGQEFAIGDLLGLSVTYDAQTSVVGSTLLCLMLLWQFGYVLLAFRRVYADGWIGAGVKAAVMIAVGLIIANAAVILSFWVAVQVVLHVA